MVVLFVIMWRSYRVTLSQVDSSRRAYGNLVAMHKVDERFVLTGDIYPLLPLTSIGRSPTNTIHIMDTFASSEHALVARRNGQWWLEDRNSRNGTRLNNTTITRPVVITEGDIINIGHIYYRVEIEQ